MSKKSLALELINELIDGTIDKDDFVMLQMILQKDPEARQDYYRLMITDQMLVDNFSHPDLLAQQVESDERWWTARRLKGRARIWSVAVATAIIVVGILTLQMLSLTQDPAYLSSSADSCSLVEGDPSSDGIWQRGELLEVHSGVTLARINRETDVCISGPATLRLEEEDGDVELLRGRAFFNVRPGAPKFSVYVGGATVRHVGTQFGIRAIDRKSCEVHVASGSVEIDRQDGNAPMIVEAGKAVAWMNGQMTEKIDYAISAFQRTLPSEVLVFSDNFDEPKNTPLSGKMPDIGDAWRVLAEKHPTLAGAGELDTSGGYRNLSANFRIPGDDDHFQRVVLMSFKTAPPRWVFDKVSRVGGSERITLWDRNGSAICSVEALARDGHRWHLRDHLSGRVSEPTSYSAIEANELTLRYDTLAGKISLHHGETAQSEPIAEISTGNRAVAACLTLLNDDGGDLALNRLDVQFVNYLVRPRTDP